MTVGFSATNFLDAALNARRTGGASMTAVTTAYVQLHTGDPGASGTAAVSAGDSTRVEVDHAAASGGSMSITGTNPTWTNGGTSETISHISVHDAATGGNFLYSSSLSASKSWESTDQIVLNTLTVSFTPVAS